MENTKAVLEQLDRIEAKLDALYGSLRCEERLKESVAKMDTARVAKYPRWLFNLFT